MNLNIEELSLIIEDKKIITDVSFNIEKGDWLGIIGPNGAGKSSLLKCILQIQTLYQGNILFNDKNISNMNSKERGRLLSYVPQMNLDFDPHFTVWDLMLMTRYPFSNIVGGINKEDILEAEDILSEFGLFELKESSIGILSGGERQRAMLASSIFQGSEILMMDEPTSFLDPKHQEEFMDLFEKLKNKTVILVTHDLNLAKISCNKVLALKNGSKHFFGSNNDLTIKELNSIFDKEFKTAKNDDEEFILPINYNL